MSIFGRWVKICRGGVDSSDTWVRLAAECNGSLHPVSMELWICLSSSSHQAHESSDVEMTSDVFCSQGCVPDRLWLYISKATL